MLITGMNLMLVQAVEVSLVSPSERLDGSRAVQTLEFLKWRESTVPIDCM